MASTAWETTALLASIRRRARSTTSAAPGFDNATLLEMANEELTSKLVPELVKLRRDWFEVDRDVTLLPSKSTYHLWSRAIVGSARNIGIVSNGVFRGLSYLPPEAFDGKDPTTQASPTHYTIRGTDVVLYPTPNVADTLRITYLRRRNRLVLPATTATVVSIGISGVTNLPTTMVISATAASLGFTTSTALDFVQGYPPFDTVADDATPTAVVSTSLQFGAGVIPDDLPSDPLGEHVLLSVGDYICFAGQSPVIQGPPEMLAILAQRVANSLLRPGRDQDALTAGERELAQLEAAVFGVAERRVESNAESAGPSPWP